MNVCGFTVPWVGACKKDCFGWRKFCKEHSECKCSSCGKQAVRQCEEEMFSMSCGSNLCSASECVTAHSNMHKEVSRARWTYDLTLTETELKYLYRRMGEKPPKGLREKMHVQMDLIAKRTK